MTGKKIEKKISGKIQLYLITAPFPKNSQSLVPYRRPLAVPYRHPLAVPYNGPPVLRPKVRKSSQRESIVAFTS